MKAVEFEEERTIVLEGVSREIWRLAPKSVLAIRGLLKPCKSSQNAVAGKYESGAGCARRALEVRKTPKAAVHCKVRRLLWTGFFILSVGVAMTNCLTTAQGTNLDCRFMKLPKSSVATKATVEYHGITAETVCSELRWRNQG
jgi:hypothetical protein